MTSKRASFSQIVETAYKDVFCNLYALFGDTDDPCKLFRLHYFNGDKKYATDKYYKLETCECKDESGNIRQFEIKNSESVFEYIYNNNGIFVDTYINDLIIN